MRRLTAVLCVVWAATLGAGPAEDYLGQLLYVVNGLDTHTPAITAAADDAAKRLLAGGQLYLAGEPGMVLELLVRAGGLCGAKRLPAKPPLPALGPNDVVLFADYGGSGAGAGPLPWERPPSPLWQELSKTPALLVAFASAQHPLLRQPLPATARGVPVGVSYDSRLFRLPSGERLIPLAAPAIATAQWAFVAELLGSCRRQGKQLAVYLSIHLDEERKRYERTKGLVFEPELKPEPVPAGRFAREFLGHVRAALEAVRDKEAGTIRQAAAWIREARTAKRQVVRHLHGHLPPTEVGALGDPAFFTETVRGGELGEKGAEWIRKNLGEGDVYLLVGYQQNEDAMAATANALGARTLFVTSRGPGAEQAKSPRHLYVDPHWPLTDGCLELPGYDVKACPLSGILGLACYYAVCAEVVAAR